MQTPLLPMLCVCWTGVRPSGVTMITLLLNVGMFLNVGRNIGLLINVVVKCFVSMLLTTALEGLADRLSLIPVRPRPHVVSSLGTCIVVASLSEFNGNVFRGLLFVIAVCVLRIKLRTCCVQLRKS